jgi:LemA protein
MTTFLADGMNIGLIVGLAIVGVILFFGIIIVVWGIKTANNMKRMQVKIREAASDIDVALTKRFDLLTKQYDICKGYAKHEATTFIDVTQMRSGLSQVSKDTPEGKQVDMGKASDVNASLDKLRASINVMVERYPELKANTIFTGLSNSCTDVEEHLQASRRIYNANVSSYNQMLIVFPSSIIANMIRATPAEFFKADEEKKQDVKMEF